MALAEKEPVEPEEIEGNEPDEPEPAPDLKEPKDKSEPLEVPIAQPSNKQRRAAKYKELEERARQAERERDELRQQRQAQSIQPGGQGYSQQQTQQFLQLSPEAQQLRQVYEETQRLHREFEAVASRPGFTEQQRQEFEQRAIRLDWAKQQLAVKMNSPQIDVQDLTRKILWQQFTSDHHDVFSNPQATQWAWGEYYKRVARGIPETRDLAEDVLDAARIEFGKTPRKSRGTAASDPATRQRLSAVSSRASAGSGGHSGVVSMNAHDRKMAKELYPNISEKEAYQKWANGPGKRLLEKGLKK